MCQLNKLISDLIYSTYSTYLQPFKWTLILPSATKYSSEVTLLTSTQPTARAQLKIFHANNTNASGNPEGLLQLWPLL